MIYDAHAHIGAYKDWDWRAEKVLFATDAMAFGKNSYAKLAETAGAAGKCADLVMRKNAENFFEVTI